MPWRARTAFLLGALCVLAACGSTAWRARLDRPESTSLDRDAPFAKCHMEDGSVVVLENWAVDREQRTVLGEGIRYDADRHVVGEGHFALAYDDVLLVETNRPELIQHGELAVLGIVATASVVGTVACIASPKSCFGSCPTFYASDGHATSIMAEGFSSSIARSLEATDVDALWDARPDGATLHLRMTNEALETHLVRSVRVLVADRPEGGRVVRAGERYFEALSATAPTECTSSVDGDCTAKVSAVDRDEHFVETDGVDLGAREQIELDYVAPPGTGALGLVVASRNSLLNTFLLYQGLAWLGGQEGEFFSRLDHTSATPAQAVATFASVDGLLGDLAFSVEQQGAWVPAGHAGEVGPIAREVSLVPLPEGTTPDADGHVHVRLDAVRGNWRLDAVQLVRLGAEVHPVALEPASVRRVAGEASTPDARAASLLAPGGGVLSTGPGDAYDLDFALPETHGAPELFLESRGYYYEWMRKEWLAEESPGELARFFLDPHAGLRRLAPRYRQLEPHMEQLFWSSRVNR